MAVDAVRWLQEFTARLQLTRGAPTLLVVVVGASWGADDARDALVRLLGAAGIAARDLGVTGANAGPVAWSEAAKEAAPGDAFVVSVSAMTPLARRALADLLNAQRQSLRDLSGPLVLLVPEAVDAALREHAPDFVTWVAQGYELPPEAELRPLLPTPAAGASAPPTPAASPPVRFLHLSDLHLRTAPMRRHDQDRVLGGLVAMLERDRTAAPVDLVFVTGDLANAGSSDEYAVVVSFLRRVMEAAAVPRERVFVVPGNHDVDRSVGRWLLRTLASDADSTEFFVNERSRRWHGEKFAAYRAAMEEALGPRALGLRVGEAAVERVEVRGVHIAVASFNSAWFAQADDDMEQLWLGEANVARAAAAAADSDFALALMHHPTAHLAPDDQSAVDALLERGFDLVLRGHLHRERARVSHGARGTLMEVAAPAAYQGSQWPNGCFVGELHAGSRSLRLKPFTFGSGADPWSLDGRVFPDDAGDGYCHTFKLGPRARVQGVAERGVASPTRAYWALDRSDRLTLARRLGVTGASDDEVERRAAERLSRADEGEDLWRELASRASAPGRTEALEAFSLDAHDGNAGVWSHALIRRDQSDFLSAALLELAKRWPAVKLGLSQTTPPEAELTRAILNTLRLVLEGPITQEPRVGTVRPDILVGGEVEPPHRKAVLEVAARLSRRDRDGLIDRVRRYMNEVNAAYGALLLVAPQGPADDASTPQVHHVTGEPDVLSLILPMG